MDIYEIREYVKRKKDAMVETLVEMCSIPAVNPKFGGSGEYKRAKWLMNLLEDHSIPYEVYEVEDENVEEGKRINIIVRLEGSEDNSSTLWFVSHLDTVGAGDIDRWNSDPFVPVIKNGRIYGRGVEDNGQGVIASLYACIILKEKGIKPKHSIGFAFVSDEETGSDYGLKALIEKGVFKTGDEAIVPDAGASDGSFIEIAEKSILWIKFTVNGREGHASTPHMGINASSVAARLAANIEDSLRMFFADRDPIFDPPFSTFEITQRYANVDSPNVLPGKDIFVMDMRILPNWNLNYVLAEIEKIITAYEYKYKVKINYEILNRVDAPQPTNKNDRVVQNLSKSIEEIGIKPKIGGIGGGTCAAILREIGIPSVVWSTVDETAHQVNEYAVIDNLLKDTMVFISTILKY